MKGERISEKGWRKGRELMGREKGFKGKGEWRREKEKGEWQGQEQGQGEG